MRRVYHIIPLLKTLCSPTALRTEISVDSQARHPLASTFLRASRSLLSLSSHSHLGATQLLCLCA